MLMLTSNAGLYKDRIYPPKKKKKKKTLSNCITLNSHSQYEDLPPPALEVRSSHCADFAVQFSWGTPSPGEWAAA